MSKDYTDYTYQGAAFVPFSMTREEIAELRQIAFRRFYGRPSYMLRRLLKLRNLNDVKASIKGLKSLFWILVQRDLFGQDRSG